MLFIYIIPIKIYIITGINPFEIRSNMLYNKPSCYWISWNIGYQSLRNQVKYAIRYSITRPDTSTTKYQSLRNQVKYAILIALYKYLNMKKGYQSLRNQVKYAIQIEYSSASNTIPAVSIPSKSGQICYS